MIPRYQRNSSLPTTSARCTSAPAVRWKGGVRYWTPPLTCENDLRRGVELVVVDVPVSRRDRVEVLDDLAVLVDGVVGQDHDWSS